MLMLKHYVAEGAGFTLLPNHKSITKAPEILMRKVAKGKLPWFFSTKKPIQQRNNEARPPPKPTKNMSISIISTVPFIIAKLCQFI